MATPKSFKKHNPALNYIGGSSEATETIEYQTQEISETSEPNTTETRSIPDGYKIDHGLIETKNKKVLLLIQPSVLKSIKGLAKKQKQSMNETINKAIQEYIRNNTQQAGSADVSA